MRPRILVVDDDPAVLRMLARTLTAEGYDVEAVGDGGTALAAVERRAPASVVLDVAMPGLDGLAVCRRLRAHGLTAPILLLTARDAVADRVAGLEAGADDYLLKPFAVEELLARLTAIGRRGVGASDVLAVGALRLDPAARTVERAGERIELTDRETALLELLLRHPRSVVSRDKAIEEIWGAAAVPGRQRRGSSAGRPQTGQSSLSSPWSSA